MMDFITNHNIQLILSLTVLAWHYCLFCGFISDDHATCERRKDIIPDEEKVDRGEGFWLKRFNDGLVMFYHTNIFWKLGFAKLPFPWHLFSFLLHLANVYLLYLFLLPPFGQDIALYTCAFWAVNPMLNQNVVWISGRPYTWGMFLMLVAFISYENPFAFAPLYFLSIVTNISAILGPIMLWIIYPDAWQTKLYLAVMACVGGPFIAWKFHARFMKGLVLDRDHFKFKLRKLNTVVRIFAYYIYSFFVPTKMGWYHQAGFRYNPAWEKFNWQTFLSWVVLGFLVFYFKLSGWWFLLGILPNANLFATNCFVQDRYLYWASVGIAMAVAPYLAEYPELFYIVMTFYITRSIMYSHHLKNDEKMYRENWRNHPKSDYAINNLSYFLIQQKRYEEARVIIEQGLEVNRTNKMLWYNLGITWAAQGNFANDEGKFRFLKAMECWKMCLQLEPRWIKPAEELKKLIKLLVDHKVITMNKDESAPGGLDISVPNLVGMKEMLEGKVEKK